MSKLVNEKCNEKSISYDLVDNDGECKYRIILKEPSRPYAPVHENNMIYQNDDVENGELSPYTELIIENKDTRKRSIKRCFQSDDKIKQDVLDDFDSGKKKFNWR